MVHVKTVARRNVNVGDYRAEEPHGNSIVFKDYEDELDVVIVTVKP